MAKFSYKGRNSKGVIVTGTKLGDTRREVMDFLRKEKIIPINIEEIGGGSTGASQLPNFIDNLQFAFKRPKLDDLIIFSRQMYSLMKAGVPITKSINVVRDSSSNEYLKEALHKIIFDIEGGKSLGESMKKHPKIFPTLMLALVDVGESTGALDEVFKQISAHLKREDETRRRMKSAMRYPIMVIITIFVAVGIINLVVVPAFANFFESFGADLPLPTKILIGSSNFILDYWYIVLLIFIGIIVSWVSFLRTAGGRMFWDRLKIRIPLVGTIIERSLLSRFARSFALTFRTGVPLLDSIGIIAATTDNVYVSDKIIFMRDKIERGESLSSSAKACNMFSTLVLQMISIGEETGEVDKLLDEVADFYEQELDYDLESLSSAIEPILISVVAVMVLILALGIFLPMWDLSSVAIK